MKKLPYNTTDKYTKIGFNEEGVFKEDGFNCLSLVVDFCKSELDLDYNYDEKIVDNITWKNVFKLFNDNPDVVFEKVEKYFLNWFDSIPPHQMRKGDILIGKLQGRKFPCVFVGNNKIMVAVRDKNVKVISLKGIPIINIYRPRKQPRNITTKAVYKMGDKPDNLELIEEEGYIYNGDIASCDPANIGAQIVLFIISMIISYVMAEMAKPDEEYIPPEEKQGILVNTRSSQALIRVIYGLMRVGGNDVYISTMGSHNKELYIVQTLSEGECDSIYQDGGVDQILIDDKPYTEFGSTIDYQFYSGTSNQTYDTVLNAADSNWTDNMRYTSYIRWKFTWDEDQYRGIPSRIVDLKGKKLYDFRDESTAWSQNPVLALYDFMTDEEYGLNIDSTSHIDIISWTTAANYVDNKGWLFNYSMGGSSNSWATAQDIMAHFRASVSWFDGKYYLLIADINEESSVMTITDDHIVQDGEGRAQIRIIQPSRFNKPKGIRVKFIDKDKEYTEDDVLIGDESGVVQQLSLMGYTDRETVGNLATYKLERLKLNRIISGTFRDDCLELAPHDLITFNSTALSISDQPMRVVSTSFANNGLINLTLQYESEELYDDDYDVDIEGTYTCDLPDPNETVVIQNASMEEETYYYRLRTFSRLSVVFTVPETEPWFKHVEVWQALTDVGAAIPSIADYEHQFNTTNDFNIDPVEEGKVYYVILRTVSIYGVKESLDNATKLSSLILGNTTPPESLTYLDAIPNDGNLTLRSTVVDDPDIEIYEFRLGPSWTGGIFMSAKRSPQETIPGIKPGDHDFTANTKGTNGLYGDDPQSAAATISLPTGWTEYDTFSDDYSDGTSNVFINVEQVPATSQLKCSHEDSTAGVVLTGSYTSDIFDTGIAAQLYYMFIEAEITVIGPGSYWSDIVVDVNTLWSEVGITTRSWYEIFTVDEAPKVTMYIDYKLLEGDTTWSEIKNAEILSALVIARYFRVRIEIEDPSNEIHAYVSSFDLKLHTRT